MGAELLRASEAARRLGVPTKEVALCILISMSTPAGKFDALEGVDRLGRVLDDVEQALVHPHLEVLAAVLVLVRAADHRETVDLSRQGTGPRTLAWVRSTVSTIFLVDWSMTSWS
jgi:hypothetical protein